MVWNFAVCSPHGPRPALAALVALVALASLAAGCNPEPSGAAATGGEDGNAPVASAGNGAGATGGTQGGSAAGGSTSSGCTRLDLDAGEVGPHGTVALYAGASTAVVTVLGIRDDYVYLMEDDSGLALKRVAIAGGSVEYVGTPTGYRHMLHGNELIWTEPNAADEMLTDVLGAPVSDLASATTIVSGIETPNEMLADDTSLYFSTTSPAALWRAPLTGGAPKSLVSGADPLGTVLAGGHLYWLDFGTERLERVPVAGGDRESLVDVFFGGPMVADASHVYWADTRLGTVSKWPIGATSAIDLVSGLSGFDTPESITAQASSLYWTQGVDCGSLWRIGVDDRKQALLVEGFERPGRVHVDATHLYLGAGASLYRVDR